MPPANNTAHAAAQTATLDALRLEIAALPPEYQVLARYIDAIHAEQSAQLAEMRQVFETGRGALQAFKWLAGLGAALAVIWGAFHGVKP
jgi:hypothetical protein